MAEQTRDNLKGRAKAGDTITDGLMADILDSYHNKQTDGEALESSSPTLIPNSGSFASSVVVFNNQTGTTYTIQDSDNGKQVNLDNASAITCTIPSGLPDGFNCAVKKKGAGDITFVASGTTLEAVEEGRIISNQFGVATIVHEGSNVIGLHGNLDPLP